MTPEELAAEAAIYAAYDEPMVPHPHGLIGRILDAHREAEQALAAGDIDGAIGADILARALTDAWLAETGAQ